jgi:hypothetical protein
MAKKMRLGSIDGVKVVCRKGKKGKFSCTTRSKSKLYAGKVGKGKKRGKTCKPGETSKKLGGMTCGKDKHWHRK